jgi:hypothetical protein
VFLIYTTDGRDFSAAYVRSTGCPAGIEVITGAELGSGVAALVFVKAATEKTIATTADVGTAMLIIFFISILC